MSPAEVLALHREVWDMPTMAEKHPEVIDWLSERWEVHFGMVSEVIVRDVRTGEVHRTEVTDVRMALEQVLQAEVVS